MDYTISYGSLKGIKYQFHEYEIRQLLQQKAERHAKDAIRPSATVSWDMNWWDDEDTGKLTIELTCEIKRPDEAKTEAGRV